VDLGCWPGGWLQEAARAVGPRGRVVGVDRVAMDPPLEIANVFAFVGDLEDRDVADRIRAALGGRCDVLLSDAAPKLTGVREADRAAEERLLEAVERLLPRLLEAGGAMLVKLLECPEAAQFQQRMRGAFEGVKTVKTRATRKGSTERFLLGRGYRGPLEDAPDDASPSAPA